MMKLEIAVVQCEVMITQIGDEIFIGRRMQILGVFELEYIDEITGYFRLWNAVLLQALLDARGNTYLPSSDVKGRGYAQSEAIDWLTYDKKDFYTVCDLAGRYGSHTRKMAKEALENNVAWRAAPGTGSRYEERKKYRERKQDPNGFKPLPNHFAEKKRKSAAAL